MITVLVADGEPFHFAEASLQPLERRTLAKMTVESVASEDFSLGALTTPEVVNDAVGRFALWGFPDIENRKMLAATDEKSDK
jgi:hypothetical protein